MKEKRIIQISYQNFSIPQDVPTEAVIQFLNILERLQPCDFYGKPTEDKVPITCSLQFTNSDEEIF